MKALHRNPLTGLTVSLTLVLTPGIARGQENVPDPVPPALLAQQRGDPDIDADRVVAAGDPDLTEGRILRYTDFIEWLFDTPFTQEQRAHVRSILLRNWKESDRKAITECTDTLKLAEQIAPYREDQRDLIRQKLLPEVLKECRKQTNNPDNQWLLGLYDRAHQPIAPGNPPLTRQASDAFAEMLCFMIGEATAKEAKADDRLKSAWAKTLAERYPKMIASTQKNLADIPGTWAMLRVAWQNSTEAQRNAMRSLWREQFRALTPSQERLTSDEEQAMRRLTAVLARAKRGERLTRPESLTAASDMEIMAKALRRCGGDENLKLAAAMEVSARNMQQTVRAAERLVSPGTRLTGDQAYARAMSNLQASHNAYIFSTNMGLISHVGTMNVISAMSGGPSYTYHVR